MFGVARSARSVDIRSDGADELVGIVRRRGKAASGDRILLEFAKRKRSPTENRRTVDYPLFDTSVVAIKLRLGAAGIRGIQSANMRHESQADRPRPL